MYINYRIASYQYTTHDDTNTTGDEERLWTREPTTTQSRHTLRRPFTTAAHVQTEAWTLQRDSSLGREALHTWTSKELLYLTIRARSVRTTTTCRTQQ